MKSPPPGDNSEIAVTIRETRALDGLYRLFVRMAVHSGPVIKARNARFLCDQTAFAAMTAAELAATAENLGFALIVAALHRTDGTYISHSAEDSATIQASEAER